MPLDLPAPEDDGLFIPDVKPHSRDKHYFLRRYLHAFTDAMRNKWSLHYIDLFAGAGIERVEGVGLDWGSPLLAAQMPRPFQQLHLCERDAQRFAALRARIQQFPQPLSPQVLQQDANIACAEILKTISCQGTLTLAFLDPYGLHLDFDTVRLLAERRADLIIFFPDHLDALRNWSAYYMDRDQSNLDRFLGRKDWRDRLRDSNCDRHADILRELYEEQLKGLDYEYFEYERIRTAKGTPLYRLIFASRHSMGAKLWRGISQVERNQQRRLFHE